MKCEIIRDLLPTYIDELTSRESNKEIREHMETCEECRKVLEQMKREVMKEDQEGQIKDKAENKKGTKDRSLMTEINPFKKLRKRLIGFSVAVILLAVLVGGWFYFHGIGWPVDREDMEITYSYDEDTIWIEFELINGRALNVDTSYVAVITGDGYGYEGMEFTFRESLPSILDDRGEEPGHFLYGIPYERREDGTIRLMAYGSVYTLNLRSGALGQAEVKDWAYAAEQSGIGIKVEDIVYGNISEDSTFRVTNISRLQSEYTEVITCESQEDVQAVISILKDANVSCYVNPNKQIVYVSKRNTAAANLALGAAGYVPGESEQ